MSLVDGSQFCRAAGADYVRDTGQEQVQGGHGARSDLTYDFRDRVRDYPLRLRMLGLTLDADSDVDLEAGENPKSKLADLTPTKFYPEPPLG